MFDHFPLEFGAHIHRLYTPMSTWKPVNMSSKLQRKVVEREGEYLLLIEGGGGGGGGQLR